MQAFEWANAKTAEDAVKLLGTPVADFDETARPIGGGQDLHTTMKAYISRPGRVVNLKTIPAFGDITADANGITIGATATLTDIENHPDVKRLLPGLVEAIHSIATPQIRNLGTMGGNLGQRPRCWYFRLEDVKCLKRGGDTCYAKDGENKYNAIFGTDAPCVMVHPSDLAPLLVALQAKIHVQGPAGPRAVPATGFLRMPSADNVWQETVLNPNEIVTAVRIDVTPASMNMKTTYLKFKERSSLDFAMASVAAVVWLNADKTVNAASVVLGGVAAVPWRLEAVNDFLKGKPLDEATIAKAADMAIDGAKPLSQNGYKLPLVKTLVRRALTKLA
ncbi:MAG: Aerobic-type carbon monoxide dehydrogenase, middle subunit CoxM/CutM-like protein [Phycisphaerales bacterium]|nr:Aerobic-type carbon monoxide dehydrogenase, middle subunit CoxM/CutM-like protein [Phycisphaerales bacterium]